MNKLRFFLTVFVCALIASVCSKKQVAGFSSADQDTTRLEGLSRPQTSQISFEKARSIIIDKRINPLLETYLRSFSSTGVSIKAFISYAWPKKPEEESIQGFLLTLVDHLKRAGVQGLLDLLELTPGAPIEKFMEAGIEESQVVFVVGTDTYYERTFQETNVRFEFERILQSPQKVIPLLYAGEMTSPFHKHLESSKIKSLFDLRNDRASYYLQLPEIIKYIYQQSSVSLWTEDLQRSEDNYLTMCQQILSGITPKIIEESKEALAREAEENENMIQMQVSLLAQNMPQDERFMPSNWYIPEPTSIFVGRREILNSLKQTLEDSSNPVFLQGPEGIGKKQLALAFAQGCAGRGVSKKYTFGAMVPDGDLTGLQHQLNLPTLEKLSEHLSQTNFLLICPDVSDEHHLQSLLRLPKGHVVITSSSLKSDFKDVTLLIVPSLSVDESVDLLTGLSGIEAEEEWHEIAKKLKYHPGEMDKVALYMRENRIIDPKDLSGYLENMEFYALLGRSKEGLPLGRQIIAKNLRRQGILRGSKTKKQEVSVRERVIDHLLRPEIEEFCKQVQKLEHREDKVLWITSPWDPSQSTLLFMERMEEDLKACGFTVRYRLDETNTQNPYVFDVSASQEGSHALLVGTPAFGKEESKSIIPLLKRFYDTGSLFPLYLEGGWGIFPAEYQKLLIEDISSSSKYAKSLARFVKQILGLKDAFSFTDLYHKYNQRLDTIEKGLTDEIVSQQGTQIQAQDTERDWQQWMDIKRRAHLLGYEVPPEVWQVMEPDITIGRRDVLAQLLQSLGLVSENEMKQVVLVGFAGMGKSHLARAYAKDTKNLYTLGATLNAASTTTLYNDYQKLGEAMGITLPQFSEELMMTMKAALESQKHRGWLLVVDNADTPEEIKQYLPTKGGHLLITSRSQDWKKESMILLPAIERQDAVVLLQARSGLRTEAGAVGLAQALGDYPLALTQAGAYIKENGLQSFEEYVTLLKQKPHLRSVVSATWAVTLEKIQAQNPDGVYILQGLSFLAPENIPHGLLKAWAQQKWDVEGWRLDDRLGKALQVLRQYSMITDTRNDGAGIHRLVQEALREALTLEQTNGYLSELIAVMDQELTQKYKYNDPATWAAGKPLSSHGGMLIAYENTPPEVGQKLMELSRTLGHLAVNLGKYKEQMVYPKRGLEIAKKMENHPYIATFLYEIGVAYGNLGKYAEQLEYLKKALTIKEKTYEADHLEIAVTLSSMGIAYGNLGDYAQKLEYLKKALALEEKTLAADHPAIATSLNNIGVAYGNLGKYAEQLEYLKKVLALEEKTLAADHPDIATSLNNIGSAYGNLGDYEKQLEYFQKALMIWEKTYAADHSTIALALDNIGSSYGNLGDYAKQLAYLQRALAIYEKTYEADHPSIATSLYAIGGAYGNLGKYAQQIAYLKKALAIREKTYEADHPSIATSLYAIGKAYGNLGDYPQQLEYLKRALTIEEKTYAADHPEISHTLYWIGEAYGNLGEYTQQLKFYQKALDVREKTYEVDHPEISNSFYAIGKAYGNLGDYAKQLAYLQRALAIYEKTYEADHPSIATSLYAIGGAYGNLGKYDQQLEYLKKALTIFEKTFAADHPYLAITKTAVGEAYKNLRKYEESKRYLEEVLRVFAKGDTAPSRKVKALRFYGELHIEMKEIKKAVEILKEALTLQEEKVSRDHPDTALVLRSLGEAEGAMGEEEDSIEHLMRALKIQEEKLPAEHPEMVKTRERMEEMKRKK
ncbi:MAG TPA: FxSxx-COOH system tetratricopeptide repeat protein [Alphaproteobacteria bacterium]|nr:FxSxx-COOH system tetratricopeptide repeat protein [Alphaproteobacteria bacterium]